jgi:hypothetical protein
MATLPIPLLDLLSIRAGSGTRHEWYRTWLIEKGVDRCYVGRGSCWAWELLGKGLWNRESSHFAKGQQRFDRAMRRCGRDAWAWELLGCVTQCECRAKCIETRLIEVYDAVWPRGWNENRGFGSRTTARLIPDHELVDARVVRLLDVPCRLVARDEPALIDGAILDRADLLRRLQAPTREAEDGFVTFEGVKLSVDPWGRLRPQVIPAFQAHVTMAGVGLAAAHTMEKLRHWQTLLDKQEHRLAAARKYQDSQDPDPVVPPGRCRAGHIQPD